MSRTRVRLCLILTVVVVVAGFLVLRQAPLPVQERQVRAALEARDWRAAESGARQILSKHPESPVAKWALGKIAQQNRKFAEAVEWLSQVPLEAPDGTEAQLLAGEIDLISLHRLTPARSRFRAYLQRHPRQAGAISHLASIEGFIGNDRAAGELRVQLIQLRQTTLLDMILLGLRDTAAENSGYLDVYVAAAPDDLLTIQAQAHFALLKHDLTVAEERLRVLAEKAPALPEGQVMAGRLLLEQGQLEQIRPWFDALSTEAKEDAVAWRTLGDAERLAGFKESAVHCYWQALRRDPVQQQASYHLGQLLAGMQQPEAAAFLDRAEGLQEMLVAILYVHSTGEMKATRRIVDAANRCGLLWEAAAWCDLAMRAKPGPDTQWAHLETARLAPLLKASFGRTHPEFDLAAKFDLSRYPLRPASGSKSPVEAVARIEGERRFEFRDDAKAAGLEMSFVDGHDEVFGGKRAFEFSGGGVGVIDYDADGWPDLYFPQGCEWPPRSGQREHLDQLHRNRGDGQFKEVARSAQIFEDRYSQGAAIGDFNADGFDDLVVANVGRERIYQNLGDGTFEDCTESAGLGGDSWSTSVSLADLTGDGLPDLYVANYVGGDSMGDHRCLDSQNKRRACTPHDFPAAADEFYVNLGDGRFEERSRELGMESRTGKGLGLLVTRLNAGDPSPSLFVANDTDGNLLFRRTSPADGGSKFTEESLIAGVQFDADGRSLACMGVAAGDATGDGLLDLVITNYYAESNMFLVQQPDGSFLDEARTAGLRQPSLNMLGFGTQFIDLDLDGWLDLVVLNGHVDDERSRGIPYKMRPQLFRNRLGRFEEQMPQDRGWFSGEYLGRALVRLDWNRDGVEDCVAAVQDDSFALLTNVTPPPETGSLTLHLIGRQSRNAVGAIVRVTSGAETWVRQISAGDGYLASNSRDVIVPRGSAPELRIAVDWGDGKTQEFAWAGTHATLIVAEDYETPLPIHVNGVR
jgi:tetratricopeptide (TPR) repeat protein